jgi:hypothetical protein
MKKYKLKPYVIICRVCGRTRTKSAHHRPQVCDECAKRTRVNTVDDMPELTLEKLSSKYFNLEALE